MSEPVTTNPLVISLINMTVVFAVLYSLSWIIRFIRIIDPTIKTDAKVIDKVSSETENIPVAATVEKVERKEEEIVAVIAAAIAAYGYEQAVIKSIRRIDSVSWRHAGWRNNLRGTK